MSVFHKLLLFSAIFMLAAVSCADNSTPSETSETDMEVDFLDVGKADAAVVLTDNSTVIIDCGEKGDAKHILKLLESRERDSADYLIITHFDKDHVGGAGKIIKELDVHNILIPDYTPEDSNEMDKFREALAEKDITPQLMTEDISFSLDGAEYTINAPDKQDYGKNNDNDFSLITRIQHGDNIMLFTGDAMEARLDELMDIGRCDLLKVPYHGRKIGNFSEFLDAVSPEYAVVSTDKDVFSSSVQKQLSKRNIPYYSTCFNGMITVYSDGNDLTISTEKGE